MVEVGALGAVLMVALAAAPIEPQTRAIASPLEPVEARMNVVLDEIEGPSSVPAEGPDAAAKDVPEDRSITTTTATTTPRRRRPLRERLTFAPYGWVRTDATYTSAWRELYSNLSLPTARLGGGVSAGPITVFAALEVGGAKGPQLFDAFVRWAVVPRLSLRAGQFKAPFGLRWAAPDLTDELPRAPLSMFAATPGRQVGLEGSYDLWGHAQAWAAVFSGIGQNREANNTKVAFAGKLELRPLAFRGRGPDLRIAASLFTYHKTNGFSPTVLSALGFDFFHGIPASGRATRVAAGGGLFWRFLSLRSEYFHAVDARERDADGDPFTAGEPLPPMIGSGGYAQVGAIVTGQDKDPVTLLPRLRGATIRASAVELSARYELFRVGARDVVGNGIQTASAGVNWILLRHLRIFAAVSWQRLDAVVPEIPEGRSWGVSGGIAGYFLEGAGRE